MTTSVGWLFTLSMLVIYYQLESRNMHKTTGLLGLILLFIFWFTDSNSFLLLIFGISLCYESISGLLGKTLFYLFSARKKTEKKPGDIE